MEFCSRLLSGTVNKPSPSLAVAIREREIFGMDNLVICVRSFSGLVDGNSVTHHEGQVFALPDGVDWVEAGFVVPLQPSAEAIQTPVDDKTTTDPKAKK